MDPLSTLLERCTVRIKHQGNIGTGFFVTPQLILTCAHVLDEKSAKNQMVRFQWKGACHTGELIALLPDPCPTGPSKDVFPDVALIRRAIPETPCVLLLPEFMSEDQLYSWGYSRLAKGERIAAIEQAHRRRVWNRPSAHVAT